jgi:lysophospholipase L1-like esterase
VRDFARTLAVAVTLLASCTAPAKAPAAAPEVSPPWYEAEIQAFEAADRAHPPASGQVLFVGSSSIRMWKDVAGDMGVPALNRGFGGSRTREVLAVADRIVFPYRPSTIVYYCGDNDLGTDNHDSAAAAAGFTAFAELARRRLPGVRILYLSIKPSVARWSNWPAMAAANALVQDYAAETEGVEFVDLAPCLLGADGRPDPALFLADGLHLNAAGYARWARIVRTQLHSPR